MTHAGQEPVLGLACGSKLLVRLLKLQLEPLALRDVADLRGGEDSLLSLERAEADLDGELRPILADRPEVEARAHRARPWVPEESATVPAVLVVEALWDQRVDATSRQLLGRVSEQAFGLGVGEHDLSVVVHDHHRAARRSEQAPERRLRTRVLDHIRHRLVGLRGEPELFGEVAGGDEEAERLLLLGMQRRDHHGRGERHARPQRGLHELDGLGDSLECVRLWRHFRQVSTHPSSRPIGRSADPGEGPFIAAKRGAAAVPPPGLAPNRR